MRGYNTSSTSILVSWDEVPADQQNGIITGYTITYQSQTENQTYSVQAGPSERQMKMALLKSTWTTISRCLHLLWNEMERPVVLLLEQTRIVSICLLHGSFDSLTQLRASKTVSRDLNLIIIFTNKQKKNTKSGLWHSFLHQSNAESRME